MCRAAAFIFLCLMMACGGMASAQINTDTTRPVQLKEVLVKPHSYNYEQDTAANRILSRKAFRTLQEKPKAYFSNGLAVNGLVSWMASTISGKRKAARRFTNDLVAIEQGKTIDSRYTPELTTLLTGLTGDSLLLFRQVYPMPFDFAKSASDLELKMWIRMNYREWKNKKADIALPLH